MSARETCETSGKGATGGIKRLLVVLISLVPPASCRIFPQPAKP